MIEIPAREIPAMNAPVSCLNSGYDASEIPSQPRLKRERDFGKTTIDPLKPQISQTPKQYSTILLSFSPYRYKYHHTQNFEKMNGKSKMLRTCFTTAFATFAFLIVFNKVFTLHQLGSSPSSDGVEPGKSKFKLPTKAEREERGSQFHPQFKNYLPVDNEIANKIEKPKVASQIARRDEDMISSSVTNQVLQSDIHTLPKQLTQAAEVVVPKEVRKNPVVSRSKAFVELGLPNHYDKDYLPHEVKLKFKDFLNLPRPNYGADTSKEKKTQLNPNFSPIICPKSVEQRLSMPALSKESAAWCDWALSPTGGQVVVGKSWGNIQRNKTAKELFDEWNCNGYSKGINPSCDDDWGVSVLVILCKCVIGCPNIRTSLSSIVIIYLYCILFVIFFVFL